VAQDYRPLHDVLQFANIPGPVIGEESGLRVRG
jgi:hypothetical protein